MAINQELNVILKQMWQLEEKIKANNTLSDTEKNFYNQHLIHIKNYYSDNKNYWENKDTLL